MEPTGKGRYELVASDIGMAARLVGVPLVTVALGSQATKIRASIMQAAIETRYRLYNRRVTDGIRLSRRAYGPSQVTEQR